MFIFLRLCSIQFTGGVAGDLMIADLTAVVYSVNMYLCVHTFDHTHDRELVKCLGGGA